MPFTEAQLAAERDKFESWLNHQQGVTGTGIGMNNNGQICIKIYTHHISAATKDTIRSRLIGLPIEFEETGEFRAF